MREIIFLFSLTAFPLNGSVLSSEQTARKIFKNLNGVPLQSSDPRFKAMTDLVAQGKLNDAAILASKDKNFLNNTVLQWSSTLNDPSQGSLAQLNDAQATAIGILRDELDGRSLLTGKFIYELSGIPALPPRVTTDNRHYAHFYTGDFDLGASLKKVETGLIEEHSGLLTTRGFAELYYSGGTNRRAVKQTMDAFLCTGIESWRDPGLPEFYIRRDVDRAPSGDPSAFQKECRTCHASMDAMAGAFAHFDFDPVKNQIRTYGPFAVAPKYNQNFTIYPDGYETLDDTWENWLTRRQNVELGWRGNLEGRGIEAFGLMMSESKAFSMCMVKRAFRSVCHIEVKQREQRRVAELANGFESDGYNLKRLFQRISYEKECIE